MSSTQPKPNYAVTYAVSQSSRQQFVPYEPYFWQTPPHQRKASGDGQATAFSLVFSPYFPGRARQVV